MLQSQDFSRTTKTGHRATSSLLVLYFLTHDELPVAPRVGLIINKSVGGSVIRHRIARQLRHAIAEQISILPPHSQIVIRALRVSSDYRSTLTNLLIKVVDRSGARQ